MHVVEYFKLFAVFTSACRLRPPLHSRSILMLSKVLGSSKWSLSFEIPHQRPVCISVNPIRATCPTHLILLACMILIIFRKQYPSRASSLRSFLRPPVTPCPTPPPLVQISLSAPCCHTLLLHPARSGVISYLLVTVIISLLLHFW